MCAARWPNLCSLRSDAPPGTGTFWSAPQRVACTPATRLPCMHLTYRSKKFWGRAFSFSPDGPSEEMAEDHPAFSPNTSSGLVGARPATAADATSPGATAKAKPVLNQAAMPSRIDHSSRARPYPVRAHVSDLRFQLTSHPALPPRPRLSVANQKLGQFRSAFH